MSVPVVVKYFAENGVEKVGKYNLNNVLLKRLEGKDAGSVVFQSERQRNCLFGRSNIISW